MSVDSPSIDSRVSVDAAAELRRFRRGLLPHDPAAIIDVILFGSRARGEARPDSDYDIAVFVDQSRDLKQLERQIVSAALPFIRAGYHFRPIAIGSAGLNDISVNPLIRNIVADGVVIA